MDDKDDADLYDSDKMAQAIVKGITGVKPSIPSTSTPSAPSTSNTPTSIKEFKVKVKASSLNIRAGAGIKYKKIGSITDKGIYTIIDTQGSWGLLKSKKGWISISSAYVDRV